MHRCRLGTRIGHPRYAVATIGILGDVSDLDQLNTYTSSSSMRLRLASQAAVKKIEGRLRPE